jgi:uncharacterized protein with HEPN domain
VSPKRRWQDRVSDIIDAVEEIERFVDGFDLSRFAGDARTIKAVLANFQIIGEAASHVPEQVQLAHPGIPWRQMRAMRNLIVHVYFAAEPAIVWQTVRQDLPGLASKLRAVNTHP